MIRHPIEDLCRGQPVPQDLLPKIIGNHAKLHSLQAAPSNRSSSPSRSSRRLSLPKHQTSVMTITDQVSAAALFEEDTLVPLDPK
jgi:hypothetical protein